MAKMRFAVLLLAATSAAFVADGSASRPYQGDEAPIGVFDSGLGGLTVLERLLDVDQVNNATGLYGPDGVPDLAREHFVYLGDQANMPYGDYSAEGKSDYLRELILKDAKFLLGTSYYRNAEEDMPSGTKKRVKIIVIACNTATAWGLDDIRRYLASIGDGTKVVGVIEAGVRATLDQLAARPDSPPFAIGVMATPGTIASGAYARTIRAELKARTSRSSTRDARASRTQWRPDRRPRTPSPARTWSRLSNGIARRAAPRRSAPSSSDARTIPLC